MNKAEMAAARAQDVRGRLALVHDPELDEPVTELRFITDIAVDPHGAVTIGFRLPTYWCAANFAFIMADDMRREVLALPWVARVDVTLGEHMYADKINHGIAQGLSFADTFGEAAAGNLDELRRTFLIKAFQRRQDSFIRHLLAAGHDPAVLVAYSLAELDALPLAAEGARLRDRYRERRQVPGPDAPCDPAFIDAQGKPLNPGELHLYLQNLQRIGVNAEFNGALCKGLLAARFGEPLPSLPDGQPTLLDFVRQPPAAGRQPSA